MAGWNWWRRWKQYLSPQRWKQYLARLRALHDLRPGLRHAREIASLRYAAEGCKSLAAGLLAGVVAGVVVARFSSWSPTAAAWAAASALLGFSLVAFIVGRLLAELAAFGEAAGAQGGGFDAVTRLAKKLAMVPYLMLAAGALFALQQCSQF